MAIHRAATGEPSTPRASLAIGPTMTRQIRVGLGVLAAFGVGCAVAPLVVPPASAQQRAMATKWEYLCYMDTADAAAKKNNELGAQYWEMVGVTQDRYCFKRPLP
jgi:hypothetical protein